MTEKTEVPEGGFNKIWLDKLTGDNDEYSDPRVRGLRLRVFKSGQKKFSLLYSFNKKKRRMPLGDYPHITIRQARDAADDAKALVRQGIEPQELRDKSKIAKDEDTIEDLLNNYLENGSKQENKEKTRKEKERAFSRLPKNIKGIYVSDLDKKETRVAIRKYLKKIGNEDGHKRTANLTYLFLQHAFNWLLDEEEVEFNPLLQIKRPFPNADKSKDRYLSNEELIKVYNAFDKSPHGYPYRHFGLFLLYLGQRRQEVATMQWSDVDLKNKIWTIKREKTKWSKRKQIVPLPKQVVKLLESLPSDGQYVLSSMRGTRPVSGFSKWQKRAIKDSEVKDWTFHDLRRTLTTNLSKLKFSPIVKIAVLNHADTVKSSQGVTGIYDAYDYFDEKKEALQAYADFVDELVGKKPKLEIVN